MSAERLVRRGDERVRDPILADLDDRIEVVAEPGDPSERLAERLAERLGIILSPSGREIVLATEPARAAKQ